MGTALLYPNDCFAPSWSHSNRRFGHVSVVQKTKSASAPYDVEEMGSSGRRRSQGRKDSPAGLLPLPGRGASATVYSFVFRNNVRLDSPRRHILTQRSLPYPQRRCRLPASTKYRCATPTQSSEFPLRDTCENDWPSCCSPTSLRNATTQMSQGAPAVSVSSASSLRARGCVSPETTNYHLYNSSQLDWRRKHKGSSAAEPCKSISLPQVSGDRENVNGQLNRSPIYESGFGQADSEMYSSSEYLRGRGMHLYLPSLTSALNEKNEGLSRRSPISRQHKMPTVQQVQRSLCASNPGNKRNSCSELSMLPSPWYVTNTGRPGAFVDLNQPCRYTEGEETLRNNDILKSRPSDETGKCEGRAHGLFQKVYSRSKSDCCSWASRSNDDHGRLDTPYDMLMAAVAERWAGPSFFNSPHPSALPVPSFASKLLRTCSYATLGAEDAAFATKQLRRMLNLDHST